MKYIIPLLFLLGSPAWADQILWQGKVENTEVRVVEYTESFAEAWAFEAKMFNKWQRIEDQKVQVEILKEICKR